MSATPLSPILESKSSLSAIFVSLLYYAITISQEISSKVTNLSNFLLISKEIASSGSIEKAQSFPFKFKKCGKQYESYDGIKVKVTYFLKVTVG